MIAIVSLPTALGIAVVLTGVLAGGFVFGVLFGRRNRNKVEKAVSEVTKQTGL